MTRLAAYASHCKLITVEITRGYGEAEWREDLKQPLLEAGKANKRVVFLFTDGMIVRESFLEDVNSVLNSGEVPNL